MKKIQSSEDIEGLLKATTAAAALGAAINTDLLWMIANTPTDADTIVETLNIPGKRGYYWLQYLESLGILEQTEQGYVTSSIARTAILEIHSRKSWKHIVFDEAEKDACVHGLWQFIAEPGSLWARQGLAEPKNYVEKMRLSPERACGFTRMLFDVHQVLANEVAERIDLTGVSCMMDLGGGSGVISLALLRKYPLLTSTVVDIENVCITGREIAAEQGLSEWISYYPIDDFTSSELPGGFDLVLQCDVHAYGKELYQKIWQALKPAGRLVLVQHLSPDETSAPKNRVEWIFLDSLRDPDFHVPSLEKVTAQLLQAGFEVSPEHQTFGTGWMVIQARKKERAS
jgi:SAM-dependent methyltransferase